MKNASKEQAGDLLFDYVDGTLSAEARQRVEEYLQESAEHLNHLDEFRAITKSLTTYKNALFCPDPVDLYRSARTGEDPTGKVREHLEHCSSCRGDWSSFRRDDALEGITSEVRGAFRILSQNRPLPERPVYQRSLFQEILGYVLSWASLASLAGAVGAAAILLGILVYHDAQVRPAILLSSVDWGPNTSTHLGRPKSVRENGPVAVLIAVKGFTAPLSSETIDGLYQDLRPSGQIPERHDFVSPAQLKSVLDKESIHAVKARKLARKIGAELNVSWLIVLTVVQRQEHFEVVGEKVDCRAPHDIKENKWPGIPRADLGDALRRAVVYLLD